MSYHTSHTLSLQETPSTWGRIRNTDATYDNAVLQVTNRGYTCHEHLLTVELVNMNGRMYDPLLGRMLSPDNYTQAVDMTQNYNRYSYALNNPLKYSDPDGEWVHLVVGAAIGGTINWLSHGAEFSLKGLGYFGVGAAAGALGAGVGAGVSSVIASGSFGAGFVGSSAAMTASSSFITGAAIGGAGGFSSGFVSGTGNGLLQGKDFGQALGSGLKTGAIAGASGALMGGIIGGLGAYLDERNAWTGADVEIGRTRLSFNNTQVSSDELYYVDSDGDLISMSQFHNQPSRRINSRFWKREGTFDRFTHDIDLEDVTQPTTTARVEIPQGFKIKGFAGVENGRYYWDPADGVSFTSNNGLDRVVTSGPGSFSFPSNGLRTVTGRIFGQGINDGAIYSPNTFRVIIRIR